jgi:hypothetical protein
MAKQRGRWQWYAAGGGAILLFCVLLSVRLGILENVRSGRGIAVTPAAQAVPASDTWLTIAQGRRKIGYARRIHTPTESGARYSESIFMRINTMGIVQPLTVRTEAVFKADRTLSNFRFELGSSLFRFTARGEVAGKKLTIRVGAPDAETERVVDLVEPPYLSGGILESLGDFGLKPGEARTLSVFDPASLGQRPARITLLGEESLTIGGTTRLARKLSVDFLGMKQLAWVDRDGSILREEGMLGIVLERVTRQEALAGLEGAVSADLSEIAAISLPKPIDAAESLQVLKVRLEGFPEGVFLLDGGRQSYRDRVLTVRRESPLRPSVPSTKPADLAAHLKSTAFIQADHPKIREKVAEIVNPGDSEATKADKLVAWVYRNIEKRPVLSVPNALETLENRVGDCNEHAVLLAAFARASGIPADVEAGIVYLRGRFFYHAWNVLYIANRGVWVTADAVLGQMPADVTHIRFVRGDADRQLDLAGLVGSLKLEILEMGR